MIDTANKHEAELKRLFYDTWYDERYKYYVNGVSIEDFGCHQSNWDCHEFVSMDGDIIIGYIMYGIRRDSQYVDSLGLVNFRLDDKKHSLIFAMDFMKAARGIFDTYNFNKIVFSVVCGNPVEPHYDRIVEKMGGRIVGRYTDHVKLSDNKMYDMKYYEILRSDYLRRKSNDS